jgi:hypothetical protein
MSTAHPFRGLATRFGAGDLARRYYHEPLGALRTSIREGGPIERRRTERGRQLMMDAARRLPPLPPTRTSGSFEVSFLSGADYWYQTLFCVYSLQLHADVRVAPLVFDDGSLAAEHEELVTRVVPAARFVKLGDIEQTLDELLPRARFPALRARRLSYPHLRKLTDLHVGRRGWTTVLDSDMLFFRRPDALLAWASAPDRPCHLVDIERAYGYSPELMRELAGCAEPERVNVGLCSMRSDDLDWEALEYWCRATLEREHPSYLQEQALTALLLAGKDTLRLPTAEYVVRPSLSEGRRPTAVLHHYVAQSKRSYFQDGWRRVFSRASDGVH